MAATLPEPDLALAEHLFTTLAEKTSDVVGITRASYGEGEQFAHDLLTAAGREAGLAPSVDGAGNLYLTLAGTAPGQGTILIGSHLDSVPKGGNYDGAAGVIAGLATLAAWRRAGIAPRCDIAVMGVRAEESTWFPYSYIGSKAALGLLPAAALEIARSDTGRSLAHHMAELNFVPEDVRRGVARWKAQDLRAYIELHIEQGPVLVGRAIPVALVTGIRGSFRYRAARVLGEYGHSGAVPRDYRRDAVIAAADFVLRLHREWESLERDGHDLAVTVGKFFTDAELHAFSKIAGEVGLCIDVRSQARPTLALMQAAVERHARAVEHEHRVAIELGTLSGSEPAAMDRALRGEFAAAATDLGIPYIEMLSGAGHDAAIFAGAGVPAAMIFVRNEAGSHNPAEAMAMEDFGLATRILAHGLARLAR